MTTELPFPAAPVGERADKAAQAFRTISEVADELLVPQHVLRFWETKFSQIRPLKRGGGRRYYRPEDVDTLRRVKTLLYTEGYTIKGVQKLLRQGAARPRTEPAPQAPIAPVAVPLPRTAPLDPQIRARLCAVLEQLEAARNLLDGLG